MRYINQFQSGIVADLDYTKIKSGQWLFPSLNARILNVEGQGMIITNVNGNDYDPSNGIGITLPTGFCIMGVQEYNGIAYLILCNPVTGEGEIGTFPSPKALLSYDYVAHTVTINSSVTGFEREYKPLANFYQAGLAPMRHEGFKFDITKMLDVIIKPSYDQTIDIYYCDGKNYNTVINSGFNQNGTYTSNYYDIDSWPNIVSQVPLINDVPTVKDVTVETGGELRSGNHFFYIKYVNYNFNRTQIVTEVGPVQIHIGSGNTTQGVKGPSGDSGEENKTDKRVKLTVDNLDYEHYKYVEISYIRHWGDESLIPTQDVVTIDHLFELTASTQDFIITGLETLVNVPFAELFRPSIKELACESHTSIDNRYYGVNWKRYQYHNDYLSTYALNVIPTYDDSKTISKSVGYKIYDNTLNYLGYFRQEIYPLGMVFVFKGGIESDVYPVKGVDSFNGAQNNYGLFRFPKHTTSSPYNSTSNELNILGLSFDNSTAETWRLDGGTIQQWFLDNIIGYYFVRGPRWENMRYQGLFLYGTRSYRAYSDLGAPIGSIYNYLGNYEGIREQFDECDYLFNGGPEPMKGSLPHGCSSLQYGFAAVDCDYYVDGAPAELDLIGLFKGDAGAGDDWANWVGQHHKKMSEDQAMSDFWGANRSSSEQDINNIDKIYGKGLGIGDTCKVTCNDQFEYLNRVETGLVMPVYKGYIPGIYVNFKSSDERVLAKCFHSRSFYVEKKYGMFSMDHIFDRNASLPSSNKIKKIASIVFLDNKNGGTTSQVTHSSTVNYDTYPWWWYNIIKTYTSYDTTLTAISTLDSIDKHITIDKAINGFVSEYTDPGINTDLVKQSYGLNQDGTCMWYWYKASTRNQGGGNRSMSTSKYIGITLDAHEANLNFSVNNIYEVDPDDIASGDMINYYDIENILYTKLRSTDGSGEHYNFNLLGESITDRIYYSGDCFLQATYIKQMSWNGSTWRRFSESSTLLQGSSKDNREDSTFGTTDEQPLINLGHGLVMEFITENKINTEMRFSDGDRTFYPLVGDDGLKSFAVFNPDTDDKTEALLINAGYNVTQSFKQYVNFNKNLPFIATEFPTRVRYTDRQADGSYIDAWRNFKELDYKDYEYLYGPMIKACNPYGQLVTIQHNCINLHYAGKREVKINASDSSLNIGTGDYLEQQVNRISLYGGQHKQGVKQVPEGVFIFNWNKRMILFVGLGENGLGAEDISKSKLVSSEIYNVCEAYERQTDRSISLPDTPLMGIGISMGYDPKYRDVIFSVRYPGTQWTLAYNMLINGFTFNYNYCSPNYFSIINDFYSAYFETSAATAYKIYIHDSEKVNNKQTFYGVNYDYGVTFVVNGFSEEENTSPLSKRYDALELDSAEIGYTNITYETLKQSGYHDNFDSNDTRFWIAPVYSEGKWRVPIQSTTTPTDDFFTDNTEYMYDSSMRGEWMKVSLIYKGTQAHYTKNVICNYEISNF